MKKASLFYLLLSFSLLLTSCSAIEGIFKAGMWTGIIIVVLVIAAVIYVIKRFFK